MNQDVDVSLESDQLEQVIEASAPPQPTVVVIQYRDRGLPWFLVIPVLILFSVGAVSVYHAVLGRRLPLPPRMTPRGGTVGDLSGTRSAKPSSPVDPDAAKSPAAGAPGPLALNSQPITAPPSPVPAPTTPPQPQPRPASPAEAVKPAPGSGSDAGVAVAGKADAHAPRPAEDSAVIAAGAFIGPPAPRTLTAIGFQPLSEASPFDLDQIGRRPPEPPRPLDVAERPAPPRPKGVDGDNRDDAVQRDAPVPTKEDMLRGVQAEAAERLVELNQMQRLKEKARGLAEAEVADRVEEQRLKFRKELLELVRTLGNRGGKEIDDLCEKYGRRYDDDLRAEVSHALYRSGSSRLSRDAKVRMLRDYGVPEPGILDFLANELNPSMRSRNGPRNEDEVRVNAARLLLSLKFVSSPGEISKGPRDLKRRPSLITRSGVGAGVVTPPARRSR